jgi:predicted nucleic acid-binding protein
MNGLEFLLDTHVVIGHLSGQAAARALIQEKNAPLGRFAVSQISRMELLSFPSLTADARSQIEDFLSAMTVILLDERIEAEAIAFRCRTQTRLPDSIIAATAQVHQLALLTLDKRLLRVVRV